MAQHCTTSHAKRQHPSGNTHGTGETTPGEEGGRGGGSCSCVHRGFVISCCAVARRHQTSPFCGVSGLADAGEWPMGAREAVRVAVHCEEVRRRGVFVPRHAPNGNRRRHDGRRLWRKGASLPPHTPACLPWCRWHHRVDVATHRPHAERVWTICHRGAIASAPVLPSWAPCIACSIY